LNLGRARLSDRQVHGSDSIEIPQERVMKCNNPTCNHGIGLVAYRRGLFGKRLYCSKQCRDRVAVASFKPRAPQQSAAMTYVEWLFLQPAAAQPRLAVVAARARRSPWPATAA
jgi:hypothetical protein